MIDGNQRERDGRWESERERDGVDGNQRERDGRWESERVGW